MRSVKDLRVEGAGPGAFRLSWTAGDSNTEVEVWAEEELSQLGQGLPRATVRQAFSVELTGLDPEARYYFLVAPSGGRGRVIAERRLPVEVTYNFRDLGGYQTRQGRQTKWGQVYRSDALSRLTDRGRIQLSRLGIRKVCDLRTDEEARKSPDLLPENKDLEYVSLPISHGEFNFVTAMERLKQGDADWVSNELMVEGYLKNIDEFAPVWGRLIKLLIDPDHRPLVFHCTGGKDRAGTAAAVLLLVLGVPEDTVIKDHQLSNILIAPIVKKIFERLKGYGVAPEKALPYFQAPLEGITAVIDYIRDRHGSVEKYLIDRAGVGIMELELLQKELTD